MTPPQTLRNKQQLRAQNRAGQAAQQAVRKLGYARLRAATTRAQAESRYKATFRLLTAAIRQSKNRELVDVLDAFRAAAITLSLTPVAPRDKTWLGHRPPTKAEEQGQAAPQGAAS